MTEIENMENNEVENFFMPSCFLCSFEKVDEKAFSALH